MERLGYVESLLANILNEVDSDPIKLWNRDLFESEYTQVSFLDFDIIFKFVEFDDFILSEICQKRRILLDSAEVIH
jgi:hypothetical protein